MIYEPIKDDKKQEWITWLTGLVSVLDGKPENKSDNRILETPDGDVATAKDLAGNLLALLKNEPITIN